MSKQAQASAGIGFGGLLTLVFVAAKLWDRVDWSWFWVFSPLWIPLGIALGCFTILGLIIGAVAIADVFETRRRRAARAKREAARK